LLPGAVAEDEDRSHALDVVLRAKRAAQCWPTAQHFEIVARDKREAELKNAIGGAERRRRGAAESVERDLVQRSCLALERLEFVQSDGNVRELAVRSLTPEHREPVLVNDREWAEQQHLGHGDDRGRRSDAEGEGGDRGDHERAVSTARRNHPLWCVAQSLRHLRLTQEVNLMSALRPRASPDYPRCRGET
jgi:hypothetical protein